MILPAEPVYFLRHGGLGRCMDIEELAPDVRPARRLADAFGTVQAVEAGKAVGDQYAGEVGEMDIGPSKAGSFGRHSCASLLAAGSEYRGDLRVLAAGWHGTNSRSMLQRPWRPRHVVSRSPRPPGDQPPPSSDERRLSKTRDH